MRKAKMTGGPGASSKKAGGKTSVVSTMTPVIGAGKGRKSASRLKSRPMFGR